MYTIKSPDNLSSFTEPVEFTITTDDSTLTSIVVSLVDTTTEQTIASRRLPLDEGSATTDFAPILRRRVALQPIVGATGIASVEECNAYIKLKVGEVSSPVITCVVAPHEGTARCVTTMPMKRRIGHSECDMLTMFLPENAIITLDARSPSGLSSEQFVWEGDGGMVALRLRASDFDADTEQITARLNGVVVAEWSVEPTSETPSARVAWRTSHGSLEHYTFPIVEERATIAERQSIRTDKGVVVTSVKRATELSLSSRYEPSAVVAALAGILSSQQVWLVGEQGEYLPAEVLSTRCTERAMGRPSKMSLKINVEENRDWL